MESVNSIATVACTDYTTTINSVTLHSISHLSILPSTTTGLTITNIGVTINTIGITITTIGVTINTIGITIHLFIPTTIHD